MPAKPDDGPTTDERSTPLGKNAACLQCKRRKAKCDGVRPLSDSQCLRKLTGDQMRPACSACLRVHARTVKRSRRDHSDITEVDCSYMKTSIARPRSQIKSSKAPHSSTLKLGGTAAKSSRTTVPSSRSSKQASTYREYREYDRDSRIARIRGIYCYGIADSAVQPEALSTHVPENTHQPTVLQAQTLNDTSVPGSEAWLLPPDYSDPVYPDPERLMVEDADSGNNLSCISLYSPKTKPSLMLGDLGWQYDDMKTMIPAQWPKSLPAPCKHASLCDLTARSLLIRSTTLSSVSSTCQESEVF